MFANNHHNDGHIAVWIPVPPCRALIKAAENPSARLTWVRGFWWGELEAIGDEELASHISEAAG
jgi:hypothetical protein